LEVGPLQSPESIKRLALLAVAVAVGMWARLAAAAKELVELANPKILDEAALFKGALVWRPSARRPVSALGDDY
jgi:hypothetical protein